MSLTRFSPKLLIATKAAIPTTMEETKSSKRERFFLKSRSAIFKIQAKSGMRVLLYFSTLDVNDALRFGCQL